MLTQLHIRDFAIVEAVELEFGAGYTALTGETGAGKSILVDALLLAVGGRADSGVIRHGCDRAEISAAFGVSDNRAARDWLDEQSIEHDGEVLLRRVISADGRSRAYVNGQAVPVQSLRALGELLLDVHGQLEFQSLSRRAYQRELLDDSAGLEAAVAAVRAAWREWREIEERRAEAGEHSRDREHRLEMLTHYAAELEALDPRAGEAAALADERRRVASLGRLAEGSREIEALLQDEGGAVSTIARSLTVVRNLAQLDAALAPVASLLEEAGIAAREAAASVSRYAGSLDADPARQEFVESRLAALESAARKHRVEPDELPDLKTRLEQELAGLGDANLDAAELERRSSAALEAYDRVAAELSARRRASAAGLDRRVTELMQDLGLRGGVFRTRIDPAAAPARTEHGADDIEFLVSTNPGQPPRPLAKTASGGELSRISLALQVATLDAAHLPCLVFDEVDAGVGGAVAEMVGRQLRTLAASGQVLCVTHLAQVAAQADRQVRVSKRSVGGKTQTRLEPLDGEARIDELARMLAGANVTETAREHAREMLAAARPAPRRRVSASSAGSGSPRARSGRGA